MFENPKNGEDPVSLEKAKIVDESWVLKVGINDLGRLER